jgi:hypothetical protein
MLTARIRRSEAGQMKVTPNRNEHSEVTGIFGKMARANSGFQMR